MNKGKGITLFAAILLFGIFSVLVFLLPIPRTVIFWLGYLFELFAAVTLAVTAVAFAGKAAKEDRFLATPGLMVAWGYFVVQSGISAWQIFAFALPYIAAMAINLVLGALAVILLLILAAAAGRIDRSEQKTTEKVLFIKRLKGAVNDIETADGALAARLNTLAEEIRFSDPMSHSGLLELEAELMAAVETLADEKDPAKALEQCDTVAKLLKKRNAECKLLKGVRDPAAEQPSKGGGKLVVAGIGAVLVLILITLATCFIIIPQNKYNNAVALLEAKDYAGARAIFATLEGYSDSEKKVQEIDATLLNGQYEAAEALFQKGDYEAALAIYETLGDYRDSKARIEQIHNRKAEGETVYLGTFEGKPIAWRVLENDGSSMLLLADKPIKALPFNEELKNVTCEESSLYAWLNGAFLDSFTEEQKANLIGSEGEKVFLLTKAQIKKLKKQQLKTDAEWWLADADGTEAFYADANGTAQKKGELVTHEKGVRPAIRIDVD